MSFLDLSPSPEPLGPKYHVPPPSKSRQNKPNLPSMREHEETVNESEIPNNVPTHPIACMQGAFAESFLESDSGVNSPTFSRPESASERRRQLLEQDVTEETHAARWKLKQGKKHHELWKLMAQISFGVYLLLNGIARDEVQVMRILQIHVDEADEFLESTLKDFELAQHDIENRLVSLKSPLLNLSVFDMMMEDRCFRGFIVQGNEWVERVITRTASAMNDALRDVHHGANACKYFIDYLKKEHDNLLWKDKEGMHGFYEAMKGNVDGWYKAFVSLLMKGKQLDIALVQLGSIVSELDRRAGEVSRMTRFSATTSPLISNLSTNLSSILENSTAREIHQSLNEGYKCAETPNTPKGEQSQKPECIPKLEPIIMAELEAPELLLKPRTYSPVPSGRTCSTNLSSKLAPQFAAELSAPISPTNSANFSEVNRPPKLQNQASFSSRDSIYSKQGNHHVEIKLNQPASTNLGISNSKPLTSPKSIPTSPSQGFDSAYCSDLDKASPQVFTPLPTPKIQQKPNFNISTTGCENRSHIDKKSPCLLTPISIQNPGSSYFRPVNASPHSPLQRPWTASPTQNPLHARPDSSGSNLSNLSAHSRRNGSANISISGNKKNSTATSRHVPSAIGRSVLNQTEEKVPRKRRGVFNWLKDQFSLNEEERMSFEQKLKANKDRPVTTKMNRESGYEERKWIDGKRVERGKMGRNGRLKK
ncbi:hypothetical protein OnM2_027060 [Erysiphe neolycopersici]|uniref:Uncharacterized protein n=1 Tax=Erysiphe neolycopersici TaxID=212602 RepID=A0A420I0D7_9PEZI|nr:hypothetical protein OnM2_027060 [Erysiphe neolycopersici]